MKVALLLTNLGSPDAPDVPAVRRYLAEFLSDRRVVDLPRLLWLPILYGIILNTRPAKSAAKYAQIWTPEGAPLKVHTERQAKLVKGLLGEWGRKELLVDWAMRYGQPSIPSVLDRLAAAGATHILVLPLYPQYAGSTTGSTEDAVEAWRARQSPPPEIALLPDYHEDAGYIAALAASVREHWQAHGRGERLLMSFHGIPQKAVDEGDPYARQCETTARLLAATLGLPAEGWLLTFQSRFGRAQWLEPYTLPTLEQLARQGVRRVDVLCPGFAADCLETLEEIALEGRQAFLAAGGREFHYIPCLNERPDWIAALAQLALKHLPA
ncbi:MAG: ferrochelatase [Rhodocyclaceae bacterium]|nr:ferrochelatase [Rhodocyclaceae bacterium]